MRRAMPRRSTLVPFSGGCVKARTALRSGTPWSALRESVSDGRTSTGEVVLCSSM